MRDSVRRRRQPAKEVQVKSDRKKACKRGFQKKGRLAVAVAVTLACLIFYFRLSDPPLDHVHLVIILAVSTMLNQHGIERVFQQKGRIRMYVLYSCIILYILLAGPTLGNENLTDEERAELKMAEPALIANLTANSPYQLGRFCDSAGACFIVVQRYGMTRGGLRAQRLIVYELEDVMTSLAMVNLKTPKIITAHHLVHERWTVDPAFPSERLLQIATVFMLEGLSFGRSRDDSAASVQQLQLQRVLQIGMGGGTAPGYLRMLPIQLHMDIVEPEPAMYEAAKRWFDFPDASPNVSLTYDSVILEASSISPRDSISWTHPMFMADDVMDAMSKVLGSHGVLSVFMFMREQEKQHEKVIRTFEAHFRSCSALTIYDDGQKFLVCSNRDGFTWTAHRARMLDNLEQFDKVMGTFIAPYLDKLNPVKK
ncbi:hypothetical protein PRIPAC_70009 [Pristionchus pacificus]|uniref:Uncharacterized protein n=1 Tax=Pristionchus pacificus TaxID=54126 RepID=A0A2A6BFN5_PRIPA|nr:hypothetical protein PRIPAC_70009 [Pristionchus pacificus]|eukprot:PDM64725.1 hypothetical protein PRIPAC_52981 [Pristionchus pacificus]